MMRLSRTNDPLVKCYTRCYVIVALEITILLVQLANLQVPKTAFKNALAAEIQRVKKILIVRLSQTFAYLLSCHAFNCHFVLLTQS